MFKLADCDTAEVLDVVCSCPAAAASIVQDCLTCSFSNSAGKLLLYIQSRTATTPMYNPGPRLQGMRMPKTAQPCK